MARRSNSPRCHAGYDPATSRDAEAELPIIIENLTEGVVVASLDGQLLHWNRAAPICAWCHKIRNDSGYWQKIEAYVSQHTDARFTHGMCPECFSKHGSPNQ
jgi:hypothetical protein